MNGIVTKVKWQNTHLEKWAVLCKFEFDEDKKYFIVCSRNLDESRNLKYGVKEGDEVEFELVQARMSPTDGFEACIIYPIEEQAEWDKIREEMETGFDGGPGMDELYVDMAITALIELGYNPPIKKY